MRPSEGSADNHADSIDLVGVASTDEGKAPGTVTVDDAPIGKATRDVPQKMASPRASRPLGHQPRRRTTAADGARPRPQQPRQPPATQGPTATRTGPVQPSRAIRWLVTLILFIGRLLDFLSWALCGPPRLDVKHLIEKGDADEILEVFECNAKHAKAELAHAVAAYRLHDGWRQDEQGSTALHMMARRGLPECVGVVVSTGVDMAAVDGIGRTALDVALWGMLPQHGRPPGHMRMARALVDRILAAGNVACVGERSLTLAALTGRLAVVERVFEYQRVAGQEAGGRRPRRHDGAARVEPALVAAARVGAPDIVDFLIDVARVDVDDVDDMGRNALMCAAIATYAESRRIAIVRSLVRRGADVGQRNEEGNKAIHYAAMGGSVSVMRWLIEGGADVEAVGHGGGRPLLIACVWKRLRVIRFLVEECGVDVDVVDDRGHGALWHSVHTEEFAAEIAMRADDEEDGDPVTVTRAILTGC